MQILKEKLQQTIKQANQNQKEITTTVNYEWSIIDDLNSKVISLLDTKDYLVQQTGLTRRSEPWLNLFSV